MTHFTARLDTVSRIISWLIPVVLLVPFYIFISIGIERHMPEMFIGPVAVTVLLLLGVLYRTTGYALDETQLCIARPVGSLRIPLAEITELQVAGKEVLGSSVGTLSSNGFLGYFGLYTYKLAGNARLYATDRSKTILLRLRNNKQIVISPAETESFVEAFNRAKGLAPAVRLSKYARKNGKGAH